MKPQLTEVELTKISSADDKGPVKYEFSNQICDPDPKNLFAFYVFIKD